MNKKWFATLTAIVTLASSPIALPFQQAIVFAAPGDVTVTITKYVEGSAATASSTGNAAFTMNATYSATNIGTGTSQYSLDTTNAPTPYQAQTVLMSSGANYATDEVLTGSTVGASCTESKPFALVGYTTGNTMAEAMTAMPTMTAPAFTGMTSDKYVIVWNDDCAIPPAPEFVTVTISKNVEGMQASSSTAMNASFPMTSTWSSTSTGSGAGSYSLDATNAPMAYQAETSQMSSGASYSTNEVLTGSTVGASCSEGKPFALVGYTTGNTMAEAASSTPSMTTPAFTGITNDKYVIVWNDDCAIPVPPPATVTVTINKYVDGMQASSSTAKNMAFPMNATSTAGNGTYELDADGYNGNTTPYQAMSSAMAAGSDYATNESLDGAVVGANCAAGKPFSIVGYTTGNTMAEAAAGTPNINAPAFTGMTSDKYVIVWNHDCSNVEGGLNGDVSGGSAPYGVLNVTSIEALDTTATADGTFANGWQYAFNVTVPSNETGVAMKFADWINSSASSTLPVANNMRISSAQANNGGATILVTAANTYTIPNLVMTGDLDLAMTGKQVRILVEVAVPANTVNGSYSTTYGVRSQ